jgi:hypothetical protein
MISIGYSLLGIALISFGFRRQYAVEAVVRRGDCHWTATAARLNHPDRMMSRPPHGARLGPPT